MALLKPTRFIVGTCIVLMAVFAIALFTGCAESEGYPMNTKKMVSMVKSDKSKSAIKKGLSIKGDKNDPLNKDLADIGFGRIEEGVWTSPVFENGSATDELACLAVQQLTRSDTKGKEVVDELSAGVQTKNCFLTLDYWRKYNCHWPSDDYDRFSYPPVCFTSASGDDYYITLFVVWDTSDCQLVIWAYEPDGNDSDRVYLGREQVEMLSHYKGSEGDDT